MDKFISLISTTLELYFRGNVIPFLVLTVIAALFTWIISGVLSSRSHLKRLLSNKKEEINGLRKLRKWTGVRPDYANGWYAIQQSNKLGKKVATEAIICDKEVVVWRGENGVAYVADAYCPHLGAHLGVEGEVKGNCIKCPFHNWQFDGSQAGKLTSIPYSNKVIDNIQLRMWKTVERNGFVWVWYDSDGKEPSWEPPILPGTKCGHVVTVFDSISRSHIQDGAENSADYSHFNALHGTMVPKKYNLLGSLLPISVRWDVDWNPDFQSPHIAKAVMKVHYIFFGKWSLGQDFVFTQYGPGMTVVEVTSALGRMCTIATGTPLGPMKTRSVLKAYCSNRAVQMFQSLFKFTLIDQLYRDVAIWGRQKYTTTPTLVKEDAAIKTFRKWYAQFYSPNWKDSIPGNINK